MMFLKPDLKVWDNQGATNTTTQEINVQQTPYENPLTNGDFNSSQLGEDFKANSTSANQGWFATSGAKHNSNIGNGGAVVLSDEFSAGLSQIIYDKQIRRGLQTLSFKLKNTEGSSEPLQENKIVVTLYGINGEFENDLYSGTGPTQAGVLPMNSVKLLEEDLGGTDYDWTEFTRDIDLGTGYDYLMFQVNTLEGNQPGDYIAIDDVSLTGEGLPVVTPEDEIVPEITPDPDIDIPSIDNPESLGTNTIENQNNLNQGIFTLPTDKNLKFSIDNIRTKNPSEIGIFIVDDEQGTINGIAPDSPDYIKLALERAKVIFSTIPNPPNGLNLNEIQRILELDSQRQFGFYTIPNGTKDTILQQINQTGKTNLPVLFSNSSQIKVDNLNQNGFTFELSDISLNVEFAEDTPAIGTKLQTQIELIDLRDQIGLLPVN
ncbi:MAG: hypothetical protein AAFY21_16555, partial [Cyanobacteria bacterium J06641_2]